MISLTSTLPDSRKTTDEIVREARGRLEQNELFRGRTGLIQIDERKGTLILRGRLPSYHLKQVLQATMHDIDGIIEIDNQVDVLWPNGES